MQKKSKIVIVGAAGLVGQNLLVELKLQGYVNIVAIDKHSYNLSIVHRLHPDVRVIEADLAVAGMWGEAFRGAQSVISLNAQISGKSKESFIRNTVEATRRVLDACIYYHVPFIVHVSTSLVTSSASDNYANSKRIQETMIRESSVRNCVLRPTLMFGWFDSKHFGWLFRFMQKSPIFPVPGDGKFMRQPLYERDFCKCIVKCIEREPNGEMYTIVGETHIDYIDIIRMIKKIKKLHIMIVHIPISLFSFLLKLYSFFSHTPPFTKDQLVSLTAVDDFHGVDTQVVFGIKQTPFEDAMQESYCDPTYSTIVLKR
ncbi:MAG: NAD-dependent epimerase/dehydratase family protein [bacterium]|nr:NAD-dependent epimerase/dehydratase family protein [bacterium]